MAQLLFQSHINLDFNEIQNAIAQNLTTAPENAKAGQFYFNTADATLYVFNGTAWVNALSQGNYDFKNGLELVEGTRDVQVKVASGGNAGNITLTADANGLKAEVAEASATAKGIIRVATDAEATAGTAENVAVNPKQIAGKLDANADIVGATKCKITYDAKGLVTAGADLEATDIPDLTLAKITDVTASADEVNILDGVTVTTEQINSIPNKIELGDLGIANDSANYLAYNEATGKFGAKVDTNVTAGSTNLVTSGAVEAAIASSIVGGVNYKGTWSAEGQTDYSAIELPVKRGYLYYVSAGENVVIGGIEWNAGDYLLVDADVKVGETLTQVSKIDNSESSDIVKLNATQTITNKTIAAGDNTITGLATTNFATGVVVTTVGKDGADTAIPTEKAVRDAIAGAIDGMVTLTGVETLTNKTISAANNTITDLETANFKEGVVQTTVRGAGEASDTALASEKAVATAVEALPHKLTATNTALTATGGVCTWTVANTLGSADVTVFVYRVADGVQVMTEVDVAADNIVIKFNSATDIAEGAYKTVVLG